MEPEFWRSRWAEGRIGFHRESVHPLLVAHRDWLLGGGRRVLVPLCGATLDLAWLLDQGAEVVGVELAELAVTTLFDRHRWPITWGQVGGLRVACRPGLTVVVEDWFQVRSEAFGRFDAAWDRGSLVALPPHRRGEHRDQLDALLRPGGRLLLSTLEHQLESGPPFSVPPVVVRELWGDRAAEQPWLEAQEPPHWNRAWRIER